MHWNINPTRWVVLVAMITAATNILSDQTSNEENLKFLSSKEMEKEWRTFKIEYGNDIASIDKHRKADF